MIVAEEINEAETRPYVEKLVTEAIFEEISDSQKGGGAVGPFLASTKLCLAMYAFHAAFVACLLYTSPSPRDRQKSRMPSSA